MPSETVAFTYNGSTTATATITGATIGQDYLFSTSDPDSSGDSQTAVASTLVLTVSTIGGLSAGDTFYGQVEGPLPNEVIGETVFRYGTTGEFTFAAEWHFNGNDTITVAFASSLGVTYRLDNYDSTGGASGTPTPGTGGTLTLTTTGGAPCTDDYFSALLVDDGTGQPKSARLFTSGLAGAGFLGNPGGTGAGLVWTNLGPQLVVATSPGLNADTFTDRKILGLTAGARAPFDVTIDNEQVYSVRVTQTGATEKTEIYAVDSDVRTYEPGITGGQ